MGGCEWNVNIKRFRLKSHRDQLADSWKGTKENKQLTQISKEGSQKTDNSPTEWRKVHW